mmetsp:Transcript_18807/g.52435  ORF Transcript_18807/g.52435 Transcript_18807/m.52435 type:complete len:99 (+) Transcript_18807:809-1105(+)
MPGLGGLATRPVTGATRRADAAPSPMQVVNKLGELVPLQELEPPRQATVVVPVQAAAEEAAEARKARSRRRQAALGGLPTPSPNKTMEVIQISGGKIC